MGQSQALRKGLGNQGYLIVSALSLSLAVEGNWHNYIGSEFVVLAAYDFSKPLGKPGTQGLHLLELQQ